MYANDFLKSCSSRYLNKPVLCKSECLISQREMLHIHSSLSNIVLLFAQLSPFSPVKLLENVELILFYVFPFFGLQQAWILLHLGFFLFDRLKLEFTSQIMAGLRKSKEKQNKLEVRNELKELSWHSPFGMFDVVIRICFLIVKQWIIYIWMELKLGVW